jgi:hypothetical protein
LTAFLLKITLAENFGKDYAG